MFTKALFVLPFAAFALIAAKAPPPAVEPAMPSIAAPAEVAANPANKLTLELSNGGTVVIQLRPDIAPKHVERIQTLVRQGFYNGLTFHRVIPGFMAQGGDPKGTGEGGSDASRPQGRIHRRAVSARDGRARRGRQSRQRQQPVLHHVHAQRGADDHYTVFGRVISGMDAVDKIAPGEPPAEPTKIVRATFGG